MRIATGNRCAAVLAGTTIAVLLLLSPGVAGAANGDDDSRITITGAVVVSAHDRVDGPVVSIDGPVRVAGVVDGDVLATHGDVTVTPSGRVTGTVTVFDGDARVAGRVGDHVTVFSGRAFVETGAVVRGDVRSSERPDVAAGAQVTGDIEKTDFTAWFSAAGWALLFLWWLAVTVTVLIVGVLWCVLLPGAARAAESTARVRVGRNILWGVLLGIALPVIAAVLAATIIGLPLAFVIGVGLLLAFPLGYIVTSMMIGRLIARRVHLAVAFLIGFAILRAVALIPGLGALVGFLAAGYGLGALAVAGWTAGRRPETPEAEDGGDGAPPPDDVLVASTG